MNPSKLQPRLPSPPATITVSSLNQGTGSTVAFGAAGSSNVVAHSLRQFNTKAQDVALKILPPTTEIFLWTFLTQDFVFMLLPRVRQALLRGAIKYDPSQDPENKQLTPLQLNKKYVTKTVQGWNWLNLSEEVKRELATGPGVLLIPTVMFSAARHMFGKSSVGLSYAPLTELKNAFVHHLNHLPDSLKSLNQPGQSVSAADHKEILRTFVRNQSQFSGKERNTMITLKAGKAGRTENVTMPLHKYMDEWSDRWAQAVVQESGSKRGKPSQGLKQLAEELEYVVTEGVNRKHSQLDKLYKIDEMPVRVFKQGRDKQWTKSVASKKVSQFTNELNQWKDYAMEVLKTKTSGGRARKGYQNSVSELADSLYRKLVGRKFALSILGTTITGLYLTRLAKWSQSNDEYPANRLLKAELFDKSANTVDKASMSSDPAQAAQQEPDLESSASEAQNIVSIQNSIGVTPLQQGALPETMAPAAVYPMNGYRMTQPAYGDLSRSLYMNMNAFAKAPAYYTPYWPATTNQRRF